MAAETQSLNAADILEQSDTEPLRVEIPEWRKKGSDKPGVLWLRVLPSDEAIALQDEVLKDDKAKRDGMYRMVIACAIDESGAQIFTDASLEPLRKKSFKVLNRLQVLALKHNMMHPGQDVELKKG